MRGTASNISLSRAIVHVDSSEVDSERGERNTEKIRAEFPAAQKAHQNDAPERHSRAARQRLVHKWRALNDGDLRRVYRNHTRLF